MRLFFPLNSHSGNLDVSFSTFLAPCERILCSERILCGDQSRSTRHSVVCSKRKTLDPREFFEVEFPLCPCLCTRGSFVVADSNGTRRYSPTVMTGEGKEETHKAMRLMLERGAPMLVTNPGLVSCATRA